MNIAIEEYVKTCRLHHRMLVVVSLTALMFGITPCETRRLQRAIDEAEHISRVDFAQLLGTAVTDNTETGPYVEKITAIMLSAGIAYKVQAYQVFWGEGCFQLPEQHSKLQRLQDYILEPQRANVLIPTIDDSSLNYLKKTLVESGPYSAKLGHLEVSGGWTDRDKGGPTILWRFKPGYYPSQCMEPKEDRGAV